MSRKTSSDNGRIRIEPQRLHALDAVRAYALLAGIVLHGTLSFLPALSETGWPIVELYLIHLPLILLLQAAVMRWPLHWSIKFSLIMGIAIPLLLWSYHYWVRPTFIGAILNGRRFPRSGRAKQLKTGPGSTVPSTSKPT